MDKVNNNGTMRICYNDIKETIRFKDAGPTIAMDYEGGVEFTYEQDIAGLNERLGGRKNENLRIEGGVPREGKL